MPSNPRACGDWLDDDVRTGGPGPPDEFVDLGGRRGGEADDALALPPPGHLVLTDDPAETAGGHQHDPETVVERELQGLGDAVLGRLADGLRAGPLREERYGVGRSAIGRATTTGAYCMRLPPEG